MKIEMKLKKKDLNITAKKSLITKHMLDSIYATTKKKQGAELFTLISNKAKQILFQ